MPSFSSDSLKELLEVNHLLTVCNDYASVMASINHGRPLRQEAPRSPALADLDRVVNALLGLPDAGVGRTLESKGEGKSGLSKLMSRFGLKS
jgi:Flp pilus assembly CpaE family ATPase